MIAFKEIAYTPLDVPDAPQYEPSELLSWLLETHQKHIALREVISNNGYSSEGKAQNYSFDLTPVYLNLPPFTGWSNNFEDRFPNLHHHILNSYGFKHDDLGSVIALPVKNNFSGWGHWHSDFDFTGLRLYFAMEATPDSSLFIRKTGNPGTGQPCRIKSSRQSFFLNNDGYEHAIYSRPNRNDARIAVVIGPRIGREESFFDSIKSLILTSAEKYKHSFAVIHEN